MKSFLMLFFIVKYAVAVTACCYPLFKILVIRNELLSRNASFYFICGYYQVR